MIPITSEFKDIFCSRRFYLRAAQHSQTNHISENFCMVLLQEHHKIYNTYRMCMFSIRLQIIFKEITNIFNCILTIFKFVKIKNQCLCLLVVQKHASLLKLSHSMNYNNFSIQVLRLLFQCNALNSLTRNENLRKTWFPSVFGSVDDIGPAWFRVMLLRNADSVRSGENRHSMSAAFINHSEKIVLACRHVNCSACCSCCSVNSSRDCLSPHSTFVCSFYTSYEGCLSFQNSRILGNGLI